MSYVIDNDNHILYWLDSRARRPRLRHAGKFHPPDISLIALNIKDLNNIKLLYQKIISAEKFPTFPDEECTMLIVGHTIQFILGNSTTGTKAEYSHFEFNAETKKVRMIDENIHTKCTNHATESKSKAYALNYFENLNIGDWIDVNKYGTRYNLAQVVKIEDKFCKNKKNGNGKFGRIYFEYWYKSKRNKQREEREIPIDICDDVSQCACVCKSPCYYDNDKYKGDISDYHCIALPRSQSLHKKRLYGASVIYSQKHGKIMIFGNNRCHPNIRQWNGAWQWSGIYSKHQNAFDDKYYQLAVYGSVRLFEKQHNYQLIVPNDVQNLILKYYFRQCDKQWQQLIEKDRNGKFVKDRYGDQFGKMVCMGAILANDGDDIFMFADIMYDHDTQRFKRQDKIFKFNIQTNNLSMLENTGHPLQDMRHKGNNCAVLCKKSQTVHLFTENMEEHYSISLSKLNQATTIIAP